MNVELKSHHYNYYNVKGHYSPETKQKAGWVQEYERNITDRVESNNSNTDSEKFQAYIKLENIYYDKGVANRAKYSSENEVRTALAQKYLFGKEYATYSYTERQAMYNNELNMTLYGHCSNFCDPRLGGRVYCETDEQVQSYNRQSVNNQLKNILTNGGIDFSIFSKKNILFSIEPYDYRLTILGIDDEEMKKQAEALLNGNGNSRELFFHIMNSLINEGANISSDVKAKYNIIRELKSLGLDFRDFVQKKDGLYNSDGKNILNVYKNALKYSNTVPAQFKGAAYDAFEEKINQIISKNVNSIPDLILNIGYSNGELVDSDNISILISKFDFLA